MIFANGNISDYEGMKPDILANIATIVRDINENEVATPEEIRHAVDVGLMSKEEFHKAFKNEINELLKLLREHPEDCDECELKDKCDEINIKADKAKKQENAEDLLRKMFGDIL